MEFFKQLKKVDYIIIAVVALVIVVTALVGFGLNKKLSKSPVESERKVAFQVFFKGVAVTNTESPFQVGNEAFITIRNVPYTKLKIVDVKFDRKKVVLPANNRDRFIVVDDVSAPFQFDFLVTLVDNAKITEDGAVVGGNKLKIGVPIVLEGIDYKLNGTISNIVVVDEKTADKLDKAVNKDAKAK